jgi:hypothetical protein
MGEYKFTPGPWKVSSVHQAGTHISPPPKCSLDCISVLAPNSGNEGFHTIASFCFREIDRKEEEEAIANARLIAAAPETKIRHDKMLLFIMDALRQVDQQDQDFDPITIIVSKADIPVLRRIVEEAK